MAQIWRRVGAVKELSNFSLVVEVEEIDGRRVKAKPLKISELLGRGCSYNRKQSMLGS
jgi:hypothetical protein